MILTPEEYNSKFDKYSEYVLRLAKPNIKIKQVKCGMLKWSDLDAYKWYGPFDGNFVFFYLSDHSENLELKTLEQIEESKRNYKKYSRFSWPYNFPERIFGVDWNIIDYEGQKSSRSTLTEEELQKLIDVSNLDQLNFYIHKLEENFDWEKSTPSKEFPIRLFLCGNDDCSYTKLFSTAEESLKYLNELENINNFNVSTFPIIERDFVFTN